MKEKKIEEKLQELENRIKKIETVVFSQEFSKKKDESVKKYEGLIGGMNFLIDNKFFDKPRKVIEIIDELNKEGYHYSRQAVDITLRRDLIKKKKILLRMMEGKFWNYVIRK